MINKQDVISDLRKELMMKNLINFRKDYKTWQVCFTHPHIKGKRFKKNTPYTFHEKSLAINLAEGIYADFKLKHTHSNLFSDHTLGEAIDDYMNSKKLGKTDIGILNAIKGELGNKDVKHINRQDYKALIKLYRSKNNVDSTIDRKFDILKAVLKEAIENEWIERFPKITKLDKKNKDEKGHRLSEEEKIKILDAMIEIGHQHLIDPFLFALATGLRRSNIQNLKKSHIVHTTRGKEIRFIANEMKWKTKHSIALTKDMECIINRNISEDSDYIFRGYNNRKSLGDFKKAWNSVRALAGIFNPHTGKYVRWHDLRHTTASDYAEKGMNPYSLMKLMHWQSLAMAERYVHNNTDKQRADLEEYATKFVPDLSLLNKTRHTEQRL